MMHGQKNIKLCDAKQVYHYKNIKLKFYKNNAAIWFNKTCNATRTLIESDGTICCLYTTMSP